MNADTTPLAALMTQAVDACTAHVDTGGLPLVGVVVNTDSETISEFGVNQVTETGDLMAHAEIVAMREAMTRHNLDNLAGCVLLATGEPCGLCYRYAIDHDIDSIYAAVDRDDVAGLGLDYRASYAVLGITDAIRDSLFQPLASRQSIEPFTRYLHLHTPGHADMRPGNTSKGTPS